MADTISSEQIRRLQEEVEALIRDRDRLSRQSETYKKIANAAEHETSERRISFLKLEAKYEEERKARFNLEMLVARGHSPEPAGPSKTPQRKLVDVGVGTPSWDEIIPRSQGTDGISATSSSSTDISEEQPMITVEGDSSDSGSSTPAGAVAHPVAPICPPQPVSTIANIANPPSSLASISATLMIGTQQTPKTCLYSSVIGESRGIRDLKLIPVPDQLHRVDMSRYLRDETNLHMNLPPRPISISRRALTRSYGLPGMGFLWASKDKTHRFLLPTYEENPHMPRNPGQSGLVLSCRAEMWQNGPWTLFIRVGGGNKPRLNYAGEYSCHIVGKLSGREFAAQSQSVKESWGTKISGHKRHPVYRNMRARITLRKRLGYEPTPAQIGRECELINAKGYTGDLTCKDVISAFERGDEKIDIVKLICVSYSHKRALEYANAQVEYEQHVVENPPRKRRREPDGNDQCTVSKKRRQVPIPGPLTVTNYFPGLLDGELSDLTDSESEDSN